MWAGVLLAGIIADKTRLTPALYFLAFGALMVNIGILPHESAPFIRGFAEVGIILIMFALGFEENTSNFIRNIRRSCGIAPPLSNTYTPSELARIKGLNIDQRFFGSQ